MNYLVKVRDLKTEAVVLYGNMEAFLHRRGFGGTPIELLVIAVGFGCVSLSILFPVCNLVAALLTLGYCWTLVLFDSCKSFKKLPSWSIGLRLALFFLLLGTLWHL